MTTDATLRARWPDHLVQQIIRKNFVLVVGAGISRACTNANGESPPSWEELLKGLSTGLLTPGPKAKVKNLLETDRYLEAAELIRARARDAGKEEDFLTHIVKATSGGQHPDHQFKPSPLHDSLMRLEPEVILTTNYDKLLEMATGNGFNVHPQGSDGLARDIRSTTPVIVKIHGSVDDAQRIVLTRSDYARLRRDGAAVIETIQALFLTRTALFVGYSMGDPDIQLLLENVLGARGDVPAHYLLGSAAIAEHDRDVFSYCYGTTLIKHADGDFAEMARMVALLGDLVESARVP